MPLLIKIESVETLAFVDIRNQKVFFTDEKYNNDLKIKEEILSSFSSNSVWDSSAVVAQISSAMGSFKRNIDTAQKMKENS